MEQITNNLATTLASGYTVGSGSITLTSASGFPASGTFSLTIFDQTTGAEKLVFRAASISGTTVTGVAEGPDVNAAAGDIVLGTMFTAAAMAQIGADWNGYGTFANLPSTTGRKAGMRYKCSNSEYDMIFDGTIWRPMVEGIVCTRPDISTFTNHGSAPDASDNTRGPFVMSRAYGGGYNWTLYTKSLPSAPFTITVGFRLYFLTEPPDQAYAGLVLRKSSGEFWSYGWGRESGDEGGDAVLNFSDPTTFGGSNPVTAPRASRWSNGRTLFVRLVDDNTNWSYYSGWGEAIDPNDPSVTNWGPMRHQQTRNNIITPGECGFGMTLKDGASHVAFLEVFHFSATSP